MIRTPPPTSTTHPLAFLAILMFMALLGLASAGAALAQSETGKRDSLEWWLQRANEGDPDAQYFVGKLHEQGASLLGIDRDAAQALQWYQRAAEQNHPGAQYEVGRAYEQGRGVASDPQAARDWYTRAARQGYVLAGAALARLGGVPAASPAGALATEGDEKTAYWPWWLGAIALGSVTIAFAWIMRAPLGVSSSWNRLVTWREDRELQQAQRVLAENPADVLQAAMVAATLEQFGDEITEEMRHELMKESQSPAGPERRQAASQRAPWPVHLTFLLTTLLGGTLAAAYSGNLQIHWDLGEEFGRLFGSGAPTWLLLLAGGFLVGFGTRMSGGCTSGHGLSGCSRFQIGSLLGTFAFFAAAVAVSFMLEAFA